MIERMVAGSLAVIALLAVSSCSEDEPHAPSVGGCNSPTCINTSTTGGSDASVADAARNDAAAAEVSTEAGVTAVGIVRPVSKFTTDPSSVGLATPPVVVRAPKVGGGVTEAIFAFDGTFTLPNVDAAVGAPTWLQVISRGAVRGIDGVPLPSGPFTIPLFDESLAQTTWLALGVGVPYPTAAATVVAHIFDAKGARKVGATASPFGDGKGPFYDDGSDVSPSAKATSALGTIVFLGITPSAGLFSLTVSAEGKTYSSVNLPIASGAVTHLSLAVD